MTNTAREVRTALSCNTCDVTVALPDPGDYRQLWDAGWRWRGDPAERPLRFVPNRIVFSCPDCPPVIS